ncbi:cell death-inducing p53-target protein 1-like [Archocentrus centrarchus]|uniref:cell death-inducing p53-target protein 1-like n=1 Tax=Archocentrus centrarchus TaxID=63155 RepID=UPI0011EA1713|nr:cell death-inducing p53-target protein 1-like [Archocentrus centrarchus]
MESLPKVDEPFPAPLPHSLPEGSKPDQDVKVYKVHSPFTRPPPQLPSSSFSSAVCLPNQMLSPLPVYDAPSRTPRAKYVSYEPELRRSPSLATCPSCRTEVTTQVTFKAGTFAWVMCLVFVLCGLVLGCCLIPLFANHFKDAYHTCPRCRLVLHVHKKQCCE